MSTSSIPAAAAVSASFPSLAGSGRSASADHSDFHQVLQQVDSAAASGTDAKSGGANFLARLTANNQEPGGRDSSLGLQAKKEKNAGKILSLNTKQGAKETGSTQLSKQDRESAKSAADPSLLPIAAVPTPAESSVSPAMLLPADSSSDAKTPLVTCHIASPDGGSFSLPGGSAEPAALASAASANGVATNGEFTAAAGNASPAVDAIASAISATAPALLPEPAMRAPFSTVAASSNSAPKTAAAGPKAKVQGVPSSGRTDDSANSTSVPGDDASAEATSFRRVFNSHPAAARESIVGRNTPAAHGAPGTAVNAASSQGAARSGRVRLQSASQSSSAQDTQQKSGGASAASDLAPSANLESTVSSHVVGFKPELAALTPDGLASGAQPTASSAASLAAQPASTVPAQPSPVSAQAAAIPQPQGPASAAPDPPPTVDSGQLRLTVNHSELKLSVQLPELGKIEVRAITVHDVTTAHLTAFRHDALPALAAERAGLEQALKSRDVILGSLDSHAKDSHAQNSHAQQQPGEQQYPQSLQSPAQILGGDSSVAAAETTFTGAEASTAGLAPDRSRLSVHV